MNQHPQKQSTPTDETPHPRRRVGPILKWVGGITAVLSLIFGVVQLWDRVFGYASRRRHVAELLATGRLQQGERDFAAAWASDSQASILAADNRAVRSAQQDVAMAWLEESRLTEGETFTGLASRLTPILQRGLLDANGARKADLLAHLGWAEFLRSRDGVAGREPDSLYRRALAVDSQNVYAHTMLGHWLLWRHDRLGDARAHFATALGQGRARDYVRRMQLAALENSHDDAAGDELIRVVNDMRVRGEPLDERTRGAISGVYFFRTSGDTASLHRLLTAVPAADHLATFQWLFGEEGDEHPDHRYMLGLLQEAAGERSDALRTMQSLGQVPSLAYRLRAGVQAAKKRLSRTP
jgi:hypothetical protein